MQIRSHDYKTLKKCLPGDSPHPQVPLATQGAGANLPPNTYQGANLPGTVEGLVEETQVHKQSICLILKENFIINKSFWSRTCQSCLLLKLMHNAHCDLVNFLHTCIAFEYIYLLLCIFLIPAIGNLFGGR